VLFSVDFFGNIQRGRRGFLGMMGGAGAALLAAACGGGSNNKSSGAATTVATRAAAATAASPASLAGTAASTSTSAPAAARTTPTAPIASNQTVTYIGADTAPEQQAWHKKFVADFQAAFPQYRAEGSEYAGGTDFYPKLQTALATNSPLDLLWHDTAGLDVIEYWDKGLLAPVTDVMEDLYKTVGGKDKFDPTALARYTTSSGEVIGVPFLAVPFVWWFRTDLLQEAGLTPPAGHWDWNFLLNAVKAVHKPPQMYGVGVPLGHTNAVQYVLNSFILSNGGHFLSQDLKDVVFDSPEVREALDMVKELAQYTPPGATNWGSPETIDAIVRGTVAMAGYQGRVFGNMYSQNPAIIGKYSNTILPYNKQPISYGGYSAHGLFKTKNLQAAKELAKFSLRKEQVLSFMSVTPGFQSPSIPAYPTDPSYSENPVLKAFDPKLLATIAEAGKYSSDLGKEGTGWKINSRSSTLWNSLFLADVVQKVVVGKESTQSAVTFGVGQIRDVMKG
jgi:ABC-type glycerol-3-phosphate transport system substrate-binding protein